MGLFWDLMQQSQISKQEQRAETLEDRVRDLEIELFDTKRKFYDLVALLEREFGRDIDGDGQVG